MTKKQQLIANVLNIKAVNEQPTISFFRQSFEGAFRLSASEFPFDLSEKLEDSETEKPENLYTNFSKAENADYSFSIDLSRSKLFRKHYYRWLLSTYFREQGVLFASGFVGDLVVYFPETIVNAHYKLYKVFRLRILFNDWSKDPLLMVTYAGRTKVLNTPLMILDAEIGDLAGSVVFQGQIHRIKVLEKTGKRNQNEEFPVLSNKMAIALGLTGGSDRSLNVYKLFQDNIKEFALQWLTKPAFLALFSVQYDAWLPLPEQNIFSVNDSSNELVLGHNRDVIVRSPMVNLGKHGPYRLPEGKSVKFIVIYQKGDNDLANALYLKLNSYAGKIGPIWKIDKHKSLYDFSRLKFSPEKSSSICFSKPDHLLEEVKEHLEVTDYDYSKTRYVAVYLSAISAHDRNSPEYALYYSLKELLLQYKITSQVLDKRKINMPAFSKYYIHNIAPALLAKAGGIPWKLHKTNDNELIVGVGAFKTRITGIQYVGSAFSFNRNGTFRKFDCIAKTELFVLAGEIKEFIINHVAEFGKPDRLIIHYYKNMSNAELKPITTILHNLGLGDIPIFIVSVNKTLSTDYIAFDTTFAGLLPLSGTILQISRNNYLLFNNTRYPDTQNSIESYHYPVKLNISSTHSELLKDEAVVRGLIDQVYQFSRVYYKSVKQQNLPVTISYPAMLAEIYSHFKDEHLNEFARTNLWFL